MIKEFSKCPMCPTGELQSTYVYLEEQTLKAYGCNKCSYGFWEPQIDTKTYTISTNGTTNDQECTCVKHTEECGWHKDWHNCTCGAFNKLILSATFDKVKQQIIVTKTDNKTVAVPLSWFTPSGTGLKPEPENIKIIDNGQTLVLGKYEAAVDYMLQEWDK